MTAEQDGRTPAVLTFGGEIYNYRELRADLISRGHRFRTESDTEVVLRGYVEWGEGVADKLDGMLAFGIWDVWNEELLLVRDRMGVKPLYYYPTPNGVLFGSEPKAILAHPEIPRRVNTNGLRELLDMVKTPEHAIFTGDVRDPAGAHGPRTPRRHRQPAADLRRPAVQPAVRRTGLLRGDRAGRPGRRTGAVVLCRLRDTA